MDAVTVVILSELVELSPQIHVVPEENVIRIFSSKGPDHPFDEWMR
jgi:hypothetical protein